MSEARLTAEFQLDLAHQCWYDRNQSNFAKQKFCRDHASATSFKLYVCFEVAGSDARPGHKRLAKHALRRSFDLRHRLAKTGALVIVLPSNRPVKSVFKCQKHLSLMTFWNFSIRSGGKPFLYGFSFPFACHMQHSRWGQEGMSVDVYLKKNRGNQKRSATRGLCRISPILVLLFPTRLIAEF